VKKIAVQHHHAHIASVIADQGLLDETVIGVAFDGTGYGTDGAIWGGEFLVADCRDFIRAAHLEYTPLPGGSQAIAQPWRTAAACLHHVYGQRMSSLKIDFIRRLQEKPWGVLEQMIKTGQNCPPSSSMGRLFDAVAALLGVRESNHYEGQAAIELEQLADENCENSYAWVDDDDDPVPVIGNQRLIRAIVNDLAQGIESSIIAARFHNSVADMTASVCSRLRNSTGLSRVVLSGGVFQNVFLLNRLIPKLENTGFTTHLPNSVPVNDGGLSLGQAIVAHARMGWAETNTA
jgi:hydrogenase maturation protein HypF